MLSCIQMKHENIATIIPLSSAIIVPIKKVFLWWLFSSFKKGRLFGYIIIVFFVSYS